MDWIELTDFAVPCVLGVLDREQREHQTLEIALRLGLDLDGAAGGDLSASVDYAGVMVQVATIVQQGRWRLLESMAAAICRHLLAEPGPSEGRAPIRVVEVRLRIGYLIRVRGGSRASSPITRVPAGDPGTHDREREPGKQQMGEGVGAHVNDPRSGLAGL